MSSKSIRRYSRNSSFSLRSMVFSPCSLSMVSRTLLSSSWRFSLSVCALGLHAPRAQLAASRPGSGSCVAALRIHRAHSRVSSAGHRCRLGAFWSPCAQRRASCFQAIGDNRHHQTLNRNYHRGVQLPPPASLFFFIFSFSRLKRLELGLKTGDLRRKFRAPINHGILLFYQMDVRGGWIHDHDVRTEFTPIDIEIVHGNQH